MSDGEESTGELQQLRQRLVQLQAENERLSGGGTVGNASSSATSTQPVRREQALFIPRERRCPKFSGSATAGSLSVEEWIEEAKSCIRATHMSNFDKALFLFDHLEGEARNEVKYRPTATRENPESIIEVLREVYGCAKSYVYWQQRFFNRKQKDNESLFEFSHALMEMLDKVKQSNEGPIRNPDVVLRDQFCENVSDPMLRRELKRLVRADSGLTLLAVRKEAIRWVQEGQSNRDRSYRAPGVSSEAQVVSQCVTAPQSSEFAELKDLVLKQQAQLDMLVRQLGHLSGRSQAPPPPRGGQYKRAPDGQPICLRCDQPGHIARYCQAATSTKNSGSASRLPPDIPPNLATGTDNLLSQSGN